MLAKNSAPELEWSMWHVVWGAHQSTLAGWMFVLEEILDDVLNSSDEISPQLCSTTDPQSLCLAAKISVSRSFVYWFIGFTSTFSSSSYNLWMSRCVYISQFSVLKSCTKLNLSQSHLRFE